VATVVVIEDEALLGRQIARALGAAGHEVRVEATCAAGLAAVEASGPDLVLSDLRLPDGSGLELLERVQQLDPRLPVVLMTAYGSVADAVEAMRRGAADYLQKPLDLEELRLLVERVVGRTRRERELTWLRSRDRALPEGLIGRDPSLLAAFDQAQRIRAAGLPPGRRPAILIHGETGTGKGMVARALHEVLGGGPFLEVNCTAMPEALVEAELFGHERGSFTDAKAERVGLFEAAEGGTLFLDEIGHASLSTQAKLLKVIEDKRVRRLGSSRDRAVDVHVIAATNRDLDAAVAEREFREDLLHRLRVLSVDVPPLRERPGDFGLLARHFSTEFGLLYGRSFELTEDALAELGRYPWPGNVRELRNVIERAVLLADGDRLGAALFAQILRPRGREPQADPFRLPDGGISLETLERDLIRQALERAGGNRTRAAALLGLSRDTLRYRLEKYGIG
jgi:two-component system, NtrC family, response regulator AtoC